MLILTCKTVAHGLVMVYQLISLNVAINSFDHALLTLLVSNQFVEIKGSVFKKFEKDSLFQITCAGAELRIISGYLVTFFQISWNVSRLCSCLPSLVFAT